MKNMKCFLLLTWFSISLICLAQEDTSPANPGDIYFSLDVEAITGESQLRGCEYYDDCLWITGAGSATDPNYLYKIDPFCGTLLAAYEQPALASNYGIGDLAVANNKLYGACDSLLFSFDLESETWDTPSLLSIGSLLALAYDGNNFWAKAYNSNFLYKLDINGNVINQYFSELLANCHGATFDWEYNVLYLFDQFDAKFYQFDLNGNYTNVYFAATGVQSNGFAGGVFYFDYNARFPHAFGSLGYIEQDVQGAFAAMELYPFLIPPDDVGVYCLDMYNEYPSGLISPTTDIINFTWESASFDVTMTIGDYSATKWVSELEPYAVVQVVFDDWLAVEGSYLVEVCTNLEGDTDPSNDCKAREVNISDPPAGPAPEGFMASYEEGEGVQCSWGFSPPEQWIGYDDGTNNDGLGLDEGGTYWGAIRFEPENLIAYDNSMIAKVAFFPRKFANASDFTLMIWEEPDAANLVYEQVITGINWNEWNEVELDSVHYINATTELWIGFKVVNPANEYPLGYDSGPAVTGFGDLVSFDGQSWETLSGYGLDFNFNLKALVVENADTVAMDKTIIQTKAISNPGGKLVAGNLKPSLAPAFVNSNKSLLGCNVYRDNVKVNPDIIPPATQEYLDDFHTIGTYVYTAKAVYEDGLSDHSNPATVTIPGAIIAVEPDAIMETHNYFPMISTRTLTISNSGNIPLDWQIYFYDNDCKAKMIFSPMTYCDASTENEDEYITNVSCGSIDNSSGWQGGVANYTGISTDILSGSSKEINVTNGNPWASDRVTVWLDWNENLIFDTGTNEEFILENVLGTGELFTGQISVPEATPNGQFRMRIRMTYSASPEPCGSSPYGEIEDYSIVVPPYQPSWWSIAPMSDEVAPGESQELTITFSSENLEPGVYADVLSIFSNDINNPIIEIPLSLTPGAYLFPPTNLTASVQNGNDVLLQWQAPPEKLSDEGAPGTKLLQGYNVYRNQEIIATNIPETEYLDTNLMVGTYEYFVTALYDAGQSQPSNIVVVTGFPPPGPPQNLSYEIAGDSIYLAWEPPANGYFEEYRIYRDGSQIGSTVDEEYVEELPAMFPVIYYVTAFSYSTGESDSSNNVIVLTPGIREIEAGIQLYPNPAIASLVIQSDRDLISIEIFNAHGKSVFQRLLAGKKQQINTSTFQPGFYTIRLKIGEDVFIRKLVIR